MWYSSASSKLLGCIGVLLIVAAFFLPEGTVMFLIAGAVALVLAPLPSWWSRASRLPEDGWDRIAGSGPATLGLDMEDREWAEMARRKVERRLRREERARQRRERDA